MWIACDGTNFEEIPLEFVPSRAIRRVVLVAGKDATICTNPKHFVQPSSIVETRNH
jgi:hypothetical protein